MTEVQETEKKESTMEEAMKAAEEMQTLDTLCDRDNQTNKEEDPQIACNMDEMRNAFYSTSKNLFEAAKSLKPYDVLYTDTLLSQAQYFLNLADNYDTLYSIATMIDDTPLGKLSSKVPAEALDKISDYVSAIEDRMTTLENKADVPEEVTANVDSLADAIIENLNKEK